MYESLPNRNLSEAGELSQAFSKLGLSSFHEACEYVWKLPYGRTSDRANWRLILTEGQGACSTKHALLKELADELEVSVDLVVGIYPMTEANTPGVGNVLTEYGFEFIPEAHCYLSYQGVRVDLTRYGIEADEVINDFFSEKVIEPNGIGEEKQEFHKEYIRNKYGESEFEEIWKAREECITAIST
ncbi:hypothetical protein [Microbulbifer sp. JMSA008]|uniref:hypothetical protein n=1 Tax=unclassified Microbulbifer TaxID=2619833 RepID=UPI00403ACAF6